MTPEEPLDLVCTEENHLHSGCSQWLCEAHRNFRESFQTQLDESQGQLQTGAPDACRSLETFDTYHPSGETA